MLYVLDQKAIWLNAPILVGVIITVMQMNA